MVMAAVVWGQYTQHRPSSTPAAATASRTCAVIFTNSKDLVWYLKKIGEVELARYVDKHWLYHTIARTLWEVFDEDD